MHIFLYCGYSYNEEINEANVAHHTLYRNPGIFSSVSRCVGLCK